jgi:hypothetical protein
MIYMFIVQKYPKVNNYMIMNYIFLLLLIIGILSSSIHASCVSSCRSFIHNSCMEGNGEKYRFPLLNTMYGGVL